MIINTKELVYKIREQIKEEVAELNYKPRLLIIQIEGDRASDSYVKNKMKLGAELGLKVGHQLLPSNITQKELEIYIKAMNESSYDGIIVQLPLPKHIDERAVLELIDPKKDVDGLTSAQMGYLATNHDETLIPCTAHGVLQMLLSLCPDLSGKDVTIVNSSNLIGKPLRELLNQRKCTVTLCHSKTKDLKSKMRNADIVITGIGKPYYFDYTYFTDSQIIIDCGLSYYEAAGKLVGDVWLPQVEDRLNVLIASGTGHTGLATTTMLMYNTLQACKRNHKE